MVRFLFRNLKGYRFLIVIAVVMTVAQVGAAILLAFPLKWILDKIVPPTRDPIIPPFMNGILSFFDRFGITRGLPAAQVHTALGVILFSSSSLIVFGILGSIPAHSDLYVAPYMAPHLSD